MDRSTRIAVYGYDRENLEPDNRPPKEKLKQFLKGCAVYLGIIIILSIISHLINFFS